MKRIILALILGVMVSVTGVGFADYSFGVYTPPTGATDYTQDTDCVVAYFMNASDNEVDRSGNGITLTNVSDVSGIPTSADVPSGYSGTSRDLEADDTEYMSGSAIDMINSFTFCVWLKPESDNYGHLVAEHNITSNNYGWRLNLYDTGRLGGATSSTGADWGTFVSSDNT